MWNHFCLNFKQIIQLGNLIDLLTLQLPSFQGIRAKKILILNALHAAQGFSTDDIMVIKASR